MGSGDGALVMPSETRLIEHAHALRCDDGRHFRRVPELEEMARLRVALLASPETAQPLDWLEQDQPVLAVEVVLAAVARMGRELAAGAAIRDAAIASIFGRLVESGVDPGTGSPRVTLGRLRELSAVEPVDSPRLSIAEPTPATLLADLLRLRPTIDAATWLREERGGFCARLALRAVLEAETSVLRSAPLEGGCSAGRRLVVTLRQLSEHAGGFTIDLEVDFQMPAVPVPPVPDESRASAAYTTWEGFERLTDSEGRRYAVWPAQQSATRSPWPWHKRHWHQRLSLHCAPALTRAERGPTRLVLESPSAALSTYRRSAMGQLIPVPSPSFGRLRCAVELPALPKPLKSPRVTGSCRSCM
jgi:hypothetical protein